MDGRFRSVRRHVHPCVLARPSVRQVVVDRNRRAAIVHNHRDRGRQATVTGPSRREAVGRNHLVTAIARSRRAGVGIDRNRQAVATVHNLRVGIGRNLRVMAIGRSPAMATDHPPVRIRSREITGITAANNDEGAIHPVATIQTLLCQPRRVSLYELQESIEQPARDFAHSGRFCA